MRCNKRGCGEGAMGRPARHMVSCWHWWPQSDRQPRDLWVAAATRAAACFMCAISPLLPTPVTHCHLPQTSRSLQSCFLPRHFSMLRDSPIILPPCSETAWISLQLSVMGSHTSAAYDQWISSNYSHNTWNDLQPLPASSAYWFVCHSVGHFLHSFMTQQEEGSDKLLVYLPMRETMS